MEKKNHIYKVIKVRIRASPNDLDRIMLYRKECARVWNDCVAICDQYKRETGLIYNQYDLQRIFSKREYEVPTHVLQQVLFKYIRAVVGISRAKKAGATRLRYPYKKKEYFNAIFDYQAFKVNYDSNNSFIGIAIKQR
jgi:hypothetical protein